MRRLASGTDADSAASPGTAATPADSAGSPGARPVMRRLASGTEALAAAAPGDASAPPSSRPTSASTTELATGDSRVTEDGSRPSSIPLKADWRTSPSRLQPPSSARMTSRGSIQLDPAQVAARAPAVGRTGTGRTPAHRAARGGDAGPGRRTPSPPSRRTGADRRPSPPTTRAPSSLAFPSPGVQPPTTSACSGRSFSFSHAAGPPARLVARPADAWRRSPRAPASDAARRTPAPRRRHGRRSGRSSRRGRSPGGARLRSSSGTRSERPAVVTEQVEDLVDERRGGGLRVAPRLSPPSHLPAAVRSDRTSPARDRRSSGRSAPGGARSRVARRGRARRPRRRRSPPRRPIQFAGGGSSRGKYVAASWPFRVKIRTLPSATMASTR